eukprot:5093885-Pyramimonas_sp.AAC.1
MPQPEQVQWDKVIDKQIRTYIQLVEDQKTQRELESKMRENSLAHIRGDPTGLVLYHYDVKLSGESDSRPELRMPSLKGANYRLVRGVLSARTEGGQ